MTRRGITDEEICLILEGDESENDMSDDEDEFDGIYAAVHKTFENSGQLPDEITHEEIETDTRENLILHEEIPTEEPEIEIPETDAVTSRSQILRWRKCHFENVNHEFNIEDDSLLEEDLSPYEYFTKFFDDDIIDNIVQQSNLYSSQKNINKNLNTNKNEISAFIGIMVLSGIVKVPSYKMYWANATRYSSIADVMPRNRFQDLKSNMHFNNNANIKKRTDPDYDKLFKLRPFIDGIRQNFLKIKAEEHNAIDEVLIPCKSRNSIIQYIKNKPHKWGIKMFARCSSSGVMNDFQIYTGKNTVKKSTDLGISGDVVLQLCETLPKKNYKIYTDNWFSSYKLAVALKNLGFWMVGCVRVNRLQKCIFESDSSLKKKGRGTYDFRTEKNENILAVKWYDSRPVHMLSSYVGVEPIDNVDRWSSTEKKYISIPRPRLIAEYNKYMDGVDLNDMLVAIYRTDIGTKKYYFRVFYELLDVCIVNSWLLYRKHCEKINLEKKNIKSLLTFKSEIARVLLASNYHLFSQRRGRPSNPSSPATSNPNSPTPSVNKKKRLVSIVPPLDVRYDSKNHLPKYISNKQRCKNCNNRSSFSRIKCDKCNVALCITKTKDCFYNYHTKN